MMFIVVVLWLELHPHLPRWRRLCRWSRPFAALAVALAALAVEALLIALAVEALHCSPLRPTLQPLGTLHGFAGSVASLSSYNLRELFNGHHPGDLI